MLRVWASQISALRQLGLLIGRFAVRLAGSGVVYNVTGLYSPRLLCHRNPQQ